jgi:tRNA-2-methylthio-N6-dimethylallyladenosine synthase
MNRSDAERISAVLDALGYEKTANEKEADLFIVVACSVRQHAIDRIYGKIKEFKDRKAENPNFRSILSGCVLEKDRKQMAKIFDFVFEIKDLEMLPQMLGNILGETEKLGKSGEYLGILPHYESSFRAYVPISTGCNNYCTYCAVPYTRGREKSRPMNEIVAEVKNLVKNGYKEITLLGQNVNSYGHDLIEGKKDNSLFIELLEEIDMIKGDYRVYFYSNHPKDFSNELIEAISNLKHFPHYIHLPLQSGNNEIIKKMNRHYTKEQYLRLVEKIRLAMPNVTLTTDIIVGFPTETLELFQDTVEVIEKAEYDMAFIAQYSPRSGTISAKLADDVSNEEKKVRENILQKILAGIVLEHNQKLIGTNQKVLIDGQKGPKYYGRTEGYKVVEIKTDKALKLGQFIEVKIEKASAWKLLAKF